MKVITQFNNDEIPSFFGDDGFSYVSSPEVYSYFLDLDQQNFTHFLARWKPKIIEKQNTLTETDFLTILELRNKHRSEYDKQRQKFYRYQGEIYSYTYLGEFHVGHVIEIRQYNNEDIVNLLNNLLNKKENKWRKIWRNIK